MVNNKQKVARARHVKIRTKVENSYERRSGELFTKMLLKSTSLDDMIAASRIIAARADGIELEAKSCTNNAKGIANYVSAEKILSTTSYNFSAHRLNEMIVRRNEFENKPSNKALEVYQKMMAEE